MDEGIAATYQTSGCIKTKSRGSSPRLYFWPGKQCSHLRTPRLQRGASLSQLFPEIGRVGEDRTLEQLVESQPANH